MIPFKKQYFPRATRKRLTDLETGFITVGANNSLVHCWRRERAAEEWALKTSVKRTSKPNKKITAAS
jgi:hypothetical protein